MTTLVQQEILNKIKSAFKEKKYIPLHAPIFIGNENKYVKEAIDSTFVSSVGSFVDKFEADLAMITGAKHAVAIVNGTNALHLALLLAGVENNDEVLSQSLTFIATCNAISYINAKPTFVDIDKDTLGMSPALLSSFLTKNAEIRDDGYAYNKKTARRIRACVPMHTFGLPCRIDEIVQICASWNIKVVEDAAESLGSYYKGLHTGLFGNLGVFSFNGNKIVTCGGGGAIVTNDSEIAKKAKHLSTQAKIPHPWAFEHDAVGFNYRMPNLNAALACAQLELLETFINNKRALAEEYQDFFSKLDISAVKEIKEARSNYWLNAILLKDIHERDEFLKYTNDNEVMTRPVWTLMHKLPMFSDSFYTDLTNSDWVSERLVNIPSSVRV
ncbi:MAG: LegC family aminotransferase [Sediminibacterium sp.]